MVKYSEYGDRQAVLVGGRGLGGANAGIGNQKNKMKMGNCPFNKLLAYFNLHRLY